MTELDQLKRSIHDSNELWKNGEPEKALRLLDDSIAKAIRENQSHSVQLLSRHAAVISDSIGNLSLSKHYNEQTLAWEPDNPMALYGLAKILLQQGETELARQYAARCYELSLQAGTEVDRGRVELLAKNWPEFGEWHPKE